MEKGGRKLRTMSPTLRLFIESIVGERDFLEEDRLGDDFGTRARSSESEKDRPCNTVASATNLAVSKKLPHST